MSGFATPGTDSLCQKGEVFVKQLAFASVEAGKVAAAIAIASVGLAAFGLAKLVMKLMQDRSVRKEGKKYEAAKNKLLDSLNKVSETRQALAAAEKNHSDAGAKAADPKTADPKAADPKTADPKADLENARAAHENAKAAAEAAKNAYEAARESYREALANAGREIFGKDTALTINLADVSDKRDISKETISKEDRGQAKTHGQEQTSEQGLAQSKSTHDKAPEALEASKAPAAKVSKSKSGGPQL